MSYQEKRAVVSMFSNVIIFVIYYLMVLERFHNESLSNEAFFKFWGAVIVIFIPVLALVKLVVNIIFNIINRMITKEIEPGFEDELDKRIYLRAVVSFCQIFMLGYVLSMGALIIGMSPLIMFKMLLFSSIIGGVAIDVTQLYYYRKGI